VGFRKLRDHETTTQGESLIHELRTYRIQDGRMPDILSIFQNVTMGIFDQHNIKVTGFWIKKDVNELVYVCEFENALERTKSC
jgi:hypothetical protein